MDDAESLALCGSAYMGRYTPKGSSKVWKHFFLLRDYPNKAFCSHCCSDPLTVASGEGVMTYHEGGKSGTSSMKKHLERKHNLYLDPGPRLDPGGVVSKSPSTTAISSPHVTSPESPNANQVSFQVSTRNPFGENTSGQHFVMDRLLRSFLRNVIVMDLKPFQVAEDRGLREFLHDLQPSFKTEDAVSIRSAFDLLYEEMLNNAPSRQLAEDEDSVALSGYGFEFPLAKNEFIFGLVVSWIEGDWTENRMVCYSSGDSDGDLGTVLADTLIRHGFPAQRTELFALVCDGSRVVESSDMQATILPCGSSVLKTILYNVLEGSDADPCVAALLTKVRRLADFLQTLSPWSPGSGAPAGEPELPELTREDPSRLASTCDLLRSLCSKKESVEALACRVGPDNESLLLTDEDFVTLSQLASVLDCLREAAEVLECQSNVRLSLFFPVLRLLLQKLDKSYPVQVLQSSYDGSETLDIKEDQLENPAKTVREGLRLELRSRLSSLNDHQLALMSLAAALDPRFKALRFLTDQEQAAVWKRLLQLLGRKEDSKSALAVVHSPLVKRSKLASFFGDVVATEGSNSCPEEELEAYKKMPQVLVTSDPLRWWQEHGDSFPRMKVLARRYLPIPTQRLQGSKVNADSIRYLGTQMNRDTLARLLFAHENCDQW